MLNKNEVCFNFHKYEFPEIMMCADKVNKPTPPKQVHQRVSQGVSWGSNKSPLTYK